MGGRLSVFSGLVSLLLMVGLCAPAFAQGTATVRLYRPILRAGGAGEVEARVDCGTLQCSLFAITLVFDPTQIQVSDVELGLYLGSQAQGAVFVLENDVDNTRGILRISAASMGMPPPPEDDVLFHFTATALKDGAFDLRVQSLELGDLSAHPVNAVVQVITEEAATGTPAPPVIVTAAASPPPQVIVVTATPPPQVIIVTATPSGPAVMTYARIFTRYGDTLNLRALPDTSAVIYEELPFGAVVGVVDGPVRSDGFIWWQLLSPTGQIGWGVEAADNVQVLQFSDNLTMSPTSGYGNVGRAPRFAYGQRVVGASGSGVWRRPAPEYGTIRWTLTADTPFIIGGMPYGGFDQNGTPTWWYFVELPGGSDQDVGWLPEYQLRAG